MSYLHLTIKERICIYVLLKKGYSLRSISKALDRSVSTISREIKRNLDNNLKYKAHIAQSKYEERITTAEKFKIDDKKVFEYIEEKINAFWSPEQISKRKTNEIEYVPSTSTIYRLIKKGKIGKVKKITKKNLRRKGKFKRPAETRGKFNDKGRGIKKRPIEIKKRKTLGHWQGDTVESGRNDHARKSKSCLVTLVERKSRFCIAILVPSKREIDVTPAIIDALKKYPPELVKTITFDRGKEFSGYEKIESELNCKTYFCEPYCSWQKGTNENTNGLLREFYPKGSDLSLIDLNDLEEKLMLLNGRPRKCLNFKTPNEVLNLK
ncbi:MAG: IS30 family transposase [Oceanivirga sp.]|nr:IS30 family transposase [Oceanivirga sp.]